MREGVQERIHNLLFRGVGLSGAPLRGLRNRRLTDVISCTPRYATRLHACV